MGDQLDLNKAIGYQFQDQPVSWNRRDLILYAIGIGAKKDDFAFIYELDKSFAAFPTYPVILFVKGTSQDVVDFNEILSANRDDKPPGLPRMPPEGIVHASQSIEIYRQLPVDSGSGWKLKKRVVGIHEIKSGIILDSEFTLIDPRGTPYCRMITSGLYRGVKGTGTKFSKSIARCPQGQPIPKERKPDYIFTESTSENQAIMNRLSGDYNPLHIDPTIGQRVGFGGVILQGLGNFGFGARAVLNVIGGGDPSALRAFGVRFASPVKPGDTLETSMWEVGERPDNTIEISFITKNLTTNKICLDGGVAYVNRNEMSKL
ncbi:hypothetical protein FRB94_009828 [Tulasnella sp. JGI-2019a]|nr:hypothetical protein FRB94_009828 [Tulasnella sp. JGI-2019a]